MAGGARVSTSESELVSDSVADGGRQTGSLISYLPASFKWRASTESAGLDSAELLMGVVVLSVVVVVVVDGIGMGGKGG